MTQKESPQPESNGNEDSPACPSPLKRFAAYGWGIVAGAGVMLIGTGVWIIFLLIPQGNRIAWDMALPSLLAAGCLLVGGILTGKGRRKMRSAGIGFRKGMKIKRDGKNKTW